MNKVSTLNTIPAAPKRPQRNSRSFVDQLLRVGIYVFLAASALVVVYPFIMMVLTSFKPQSEITASPVVTRSQVIAPSPLTAREREVAVLVARGSSNREIAERLAISERTAEGHVEQVRNKLGFHSRAQIATWIAQSS